MPLPKRFRSPPLHKFHKRPLPSVPTNEFIQLFPWQGFVHIDAIHECAKERMDMYDRKAPSVRAYLRDDD